MEKFWASLLVIPIFTWYSFHAVLDRDFKIRQQMVENTVYQYTQVSAKKGALYNSVYNELEHSLSRFGIFDISVTAEKFTGTTDTPEVIAGSQVIGKDLRSEGYDIINIYVEFQNKHPLGRLYEITPFGTKSGAEADIRYFAKASVYIQ
ncbi:MAG: hypothetical protein APF77_03200 [Clostridia bacterium BRH_c25]|nr:MAG: hypothetical protein APF77_03200 [Clostridia bacterium BRH_c25]